MREKNNALARERRRRLSADDREARRLAARDYYWRNRERVRASFQRWLDEMPPQQRADWDARMREASRESRRRKALARLMGKAPILMDRIKDKNDE